MLDAFLKKLLIIFFADFEKAKNVQYDPESLVTLLKESLKSAK